MPAWTTRGRSGLMRAVLTMVVAVAVATTGVTTLTSTAAHATTRQVAPAAGSEAQREALRRVETVRALLGDAAARDAATLAGLNVSGSATPPGRAPDGSDAAAQLPATPHLGTPTGLTPAQRQAQQALAAADARGGRRELPLVAGQPIPQGQLPAPVGNPSGGPAAVTALGPITCPISGPNHFIDTFGAYRGNGWYHQGIDMFAREGTPVVTVAPATISKVQTIDAPDSLGGITVSYTTGNGDRWYNAHLSAVAHGVTVGQVVPAGYLIGYVGRTGDARTTPPHLHIERHPGGAAQAVDAFLELAQACG